MAKRKRLGPATFSGVPEGLETKSAPAPIVPPIANVAGDAATQAALSDVVETLTKAKRDGRMVVELDPAQIDPAYLVRDRTRIDTEEMTALITSIKGRGQQTPIEVTALEDGMYGLISGWRRLNAIVQLGDRPVLALLRAPQDAPEAYLAMIEENEIRVGLSYYERARIVARSVSGGVFDTDKQALQSLFQSASRAKRSKIKSFLTVVGALDGILSYPEDIGERLGLTLARALDEDPGLVSKLRSALRVDRADAAAEQALIKGVLEGPAKQSPTQKPAAPAADVHRLSQGLRAETRKDGSVVISGPALTPALTRDLHDWVRAQVKKGGL